MNDWIDETEYGQQVAEYLSYRGGSDLAFQVECLFVDEMFDIVRS